MSAAAKAAAVHHEECLAGHPFHSRHPPLMPFKTGYSSPSRATCSGAVEDIEMNVARMPTPVTLLAIAWLRLFSALRSWGQPPFFQPAQAAFRSPWKRVVGKDNADCLGFVLLCGDDGRT